MKGRKTRKAKTREVKTREETTSEGKEGKGRQGKGGQGKTSQVKQERRRVEFELGEKIPTCLFDVQVSRPKGDDPTGVNGFTCSCNLKPNIRAQRTNYRV